MKHCSLNMVSELYGNPSSPVPCPSPLTTHLGECFHETSTIYIEAVDPPAAMYTGFGQKTQN
jgi:hypothetical protein